MAPKPDDTNPNTEYDENTPPNPGNTRWRRTTGREKNQAKPAVADIRIARIETVTMTAAEYDNAVEALAVLITRWWDQHSDQAA